MATEGTPDKCVFCGVNAADSKEHVWPSWVRDRLPDELRAETFTHTFTDSHHGMIRKFSAPLFDLTVKDVCTPCNTGWMHRCEEDAKRYIAGILEKGHGRHFHRDAQRAVAFWGALKALITQRTFTRRELIIPEHYTALYERREKRELPAHVRAMTGRTAWRVGRAEAGFFRLNGLVLRREDTVVNKGDPPDGHLSTFSVLDLVVQIFWMYTDRTERNLAYGPGLAPAVRQIWPVTPDFDWPPGPALTQAGLEALGGEQPK